MNCKKEAQKHQAKPAKSMQHRPTHPRRGPAVHGGQVGFHEVELVRQEGCRSAVDIRLRGKHKIECDTLHAQKKKHIVITLLARF